MNDITILSLLLEGPKHGYRLKQDAAMIYGAQQLHNNTIYPLLKRYLEQGWIRQKKAPGERGQIRLLYELTAAGKKGLVEKLANFSESDAASEEAFRIRTGLFGFLNPADRKRILELRQNYLAPRLERVRQIARIPHMDRWASTTVRFLEKQLVLEGKWISEMMKQV
jgi:DNA-binding PadR family transcriptional regulator